MEGFGVLFFFLYFECYVMISCGTYVYTLSLEKVVCPMLRSNKIYKLVN